MGSEGRTLGCPLLVGDGVTSTIHEWEPRLAREYDAAVERWMRTFESVRPTLERGLGGGPAQG